MSRISKEATTEYLGANTESSTFEDHKNALLTHPIESEDFAEFVRKLTKSTWVCEVAEA
jgi:hypothetical protein